MHHLIGVVKDKCVHLMVSCQNLNYIFSENSNEQQSIIESFAGNKYIEFKAEYSGVALSTQPIKMLDKTLLTVKVLEKDVCQRYSSMIIKFIGTYFGNKTIEIIPFAVNISFRPPHSWYFGNNKLVLNFRYMLCY